MDDDVEVLLERVKSASDVTAYYELTQKGFRGYNARRELCRSDPELLFRYEWVLGGGTAATLEAGAALECAKLAHGEWPGLASGVPRHLLNACFGYFSDRGLLSDDPAQVLFVRTACANVPPSCNLIAELALAEHATEIVYAISRAWSEYLLLKAEESAWRKTTGGLSLLDPASHVQREVAFLAKACARVCAGVLQGRVANTCSWWRVAVDGSLFQSPADFLKESST